MIKSYNNKNKFIENLKSISLTKINPYYENKSHYLPYKYTDPSFKTKYQGPLMQKDLYILNLINNRINKKKFFLNNNKEKEKSEINNKLFPNVAVTKDLIFNSNEIDKKKAKADFTGYMTSQIKKKFFDFNPIASKEKYSQIRYYMNNNIPLSRGEPIRINNKYYLNLYKQKMREQTYKSWKRIKNEYLKRDLTKDKYLRTDYNYDYKDNHFIKNNFNLTLRDYIKSNKKATRIIDNKIIYNIKQK